MPAPRSLCFRPTRSRSSARCARELSDSKLALELTTHPERILSATLLMTNLCMVGIAALTALYFQEHASAHSELLSVAVASPLVVIFGELLPKTIYQRNATRLARWVATPVHWTYLAFFPITRLLKGYTSRLSKIAGPIEELLTGKRRTTREDLENLLTYGRRESELKTSEKKMIRRIFDFREAEARHALMPLVRVDAIEEKANLREALERFERHRHSRMPVYSERIDNIVGILEAADLFMATDLEQPIRHYLASAHYVSETQSLRSLMEEMHHEDNEMVVVVDEHGGAVGILTFEDIVEEIVGEINDEYDVEAEPYKELSRRKLARAGAHGDPAHQRAAGLPPARRRIRDPERVPASAVRADPRSARRALLQHPGRPIQVHHP